MLQKNYLVALCLILLSGCGYNTLQTTGESINASWVEVLGQYQRRADLIPNLVNTVKGYAPHEKEVLPEVTNARARIGAMENTPLLVNDEEAFKEYMAAQGEMTTALARLLQVAENYPQLKADGVFLGLQSQLEGIEDRITAARKRYIHSAQQYNDTVRVFPTNLTAKVLGFVAKPTFNMESKVVISKLPSVNSGSALVKDIPSTSALVTGPD
jgi:LemA protein